MKQKTKNFWILVGILAIGMFISFCQCAYGQSLQFREAMKKPPQIIVSVDINNTYQLSQKYSKEELEKMKLISEIQLTQSYNQLIQANVEIQQDLLKIYKVLKENGIYVLSKILLECQGEEKLPPTAKEGIKTSLELVGYILTNKNPQKDHIRILFDRIVELYKKNEEERKTKRKQKMLEVQQQINKRLIKKPEKIKGLEDNHLPED